MTAGTRSDTRISTVDGRVRRSTARLLRQAGHEVLEAPGGKERLTVLEVRYERFDVEPFREPTGSYAAGRQA